VLGSTPGSKDYSYSSAMASMGGAWSYDALNAFLESPASAVPGTKMSFAGVRTVEERAAIIAYLRAQSSELRPLPEVAAPAEEMGE
jgi:cytochrome c